MVCIIYIPSLFLKVVPGSHPFKSVPRSASTKEQSEADKYTEATPFTLYFFSKSRRYATTWFIQVYQEQKQTSRGEATLPVLLLRRNRPCSHPKTPTTHHPLHDLGFHCATLSMSTHLPACKYLNHWKTRNQGPGGLREVEQITFLEHLRKFNIHSPGAQFA